VIHLANALSLTMFNVNTCQVNLACVGLSKEEARLLLGDNFVSCINHTSTAWLFSTELGISIPVIQATVALLPGDTLIVGQYTGPHLKEGAVELPEGGQIRWFLINIY